MTYIGGIEALHSFTPPGATEPAIVLGQLPYRLTGITGLGSLGDSEDNRDLRVGAIGEAPRLSDRRGKTLAYEGRIVASGLLELREAEAALKAAFADQSTEGRMDIAAHPDNVELAGQTPKFFEARALNCDIPDRQATKSFTRPFVIGLRAGDPRVWDAKEEVVTASLAKTETPSSMTVIATSDVKGPVLRLDTPAFPASIGTAAVLVRNVATGTSLAVNLPAGWAGAVLSLDFLNRTITDEDGADRSALLDIEDNSLWRPIPLAVGANEFEITVNVGAFKSTKTPTAVANDATVGTVEWANPTHAEAADGSFAAASLPGSGKVSEYLKASGFGFGLPSTATPVGIEPAPVRRGGTLLHPIRDQSIRLVAAGAITGADRKIGTESLGPFWPLTTAAAKAQPYGGPEDLWELPTLRYGDVNSSGFGYAMAAGASSFGGPAEVDYMPLTVYYSDSKPAAVAYAVEARLEFVNGYY